MCPIGISNQRATEHCDEDARKPCCLPTDIMRTHAQGLIAVSKEYGFKRDADDDCGSKLLTCKRRPSGVRALGEKELISKKRRAKSS